MKSLKKENPGKEVIVIPVQSITP